MIARLILICLLPACCFAQETSIRPGIWKAELTTPGGPIRFDLQLTRTGAQWSSVVLNPVEPLRVPQTKVDGAKLELVFDHYDSSIRAELEGRELRGTYRRRRGPDRWANMSFRAKPGQSAKTKPTFKPFVGRWAVKFSKSDDPALAVFAVNDGGTPWGTFLTTVGDYRFLQVQSADEDSAELSVFDGAHAFLFRATRTESGGLSGDFWSSDTWHETWTAVAAPTAELPDAFRLSVALRDVKLDDLVYPDLNGKRVSLGDKRFGGKARIIQVFGSWCPNCHDAALYLSALERKYGPQGLSIVGLAFEHSGEFKRDAEMVRRYIRRHKTKYPVLLAGLSDKATASRQFPLIDKVRSYPTTIFMHADGRVRAVYTGFSGPATGDAYRRLQRQFEQIIEELLAEESAGQR